MIRVDAVTKRFGRVAAVDAVSFALRRGELVGFLGPNGAGKSTLLRLLATFLMPDSGRVLVEDLDAAVQPLEVRRRVGYLPGDTPLYAAMRVASFLDFVGRAHGLDGPLLRARRQAVVDSCGLEAVLGKRVQECSTGFRKRIGLAAALIHDPPVLLLDEPTHGLDPLQVVAFRGLLRQLKAERTILLSSHTIAEVAQVADRLLILHQGRLLADGAVPELCARHGAAPTDLEGLFLAVLRGAGDGR
jgi:ABC-2 type transport system ATP-binding protein